MATKQLTYDVPKFRAIKSRVSELYESSGDLIRAKKTVTASAIVFPEMAWMIREITRVGADLGEEETRFKKISRDVKRICEEQAGPIKDGRFVKMNAGVFGTMRFLVRLLEKALLRIVDDEDADVLGRERMPPEDTNRISIDLTDSIEDAETPDEPEAVKVPVLARGPDDDDDDNDDDDDTPVSEREDQREIETANRESNLAGADLSAMAALDRDAPLG